MPRNIHNYTRASISFPGFKDASGELVRDLVLQPGDNVGTKHTEAS